MRKIYLIKSLFSIAAMILIGLVGCHQEPLVPTSTIPLACQLNQLVTLNEDSRDTVSYSYDSFGHVVKSVIRQWNKGQLTNSTEHSFFYTADHYLNNEIERVMTRYTDGSQFRIDIGYQYDYQDEPKRVRSVRIFNNSSNETIGFKEYIYQGTTLKTYTETDGNRGILKRYTYDGSGKLIQLEQPNSGIITKISAGKIVQKNYPNGTTILLEYDNLGQLKKQTVKTSSEQLVYTYTYDSKPYWNKTQLLFRGGISPNLGEHSSVNNLLTYSYQRYQYNTLISEQKLTYNHAYNKEGYSLGYGRSDGVRQLTTYTNCP
ncbi:hypothetical protein [Larkinella arboricola]|nr:hypothetical protein [Larkinella arboricola]